MNQLLIALAIFQCFGSIEFFPIPGRDIHKNPNTQSGYEVSIFQIDYDAKIMDGCFDGLLPYFNQMDSQGDVLVVRHVPSVKDLELLHNYLLESFTSVMCFSFAGDKSISCLADDYVIVASQNTIFNEKEIVFHEPSGLNLLTFSIQKQSGKNISIFVLNDNVDGLTNENKKDQLEAVSDEIQNNSYPGPIVLCANRKVFSFQDTSQVKTNEVAGEFVATQGDLFSRLRDNQFQNCAFVVKKIRGQSYVRYNESMISWIDATLDNKYNSCFSLLKFNEGNQINNESFVSAKKKQFFYKDLAAKGEKEVRISVDRDNEGTTKFEGTVSYGRDCDDRARFEVSGGGSVERNADGRIEASARVDMGYSWQ